MTKKDAVALDRAVAVVESVSKFLGLSQTWVIHVRIDNLRQAPEDSQRAANVQWPAHYKEATIAFDRAFVNFASDESLERTALHELLHLTTAPLDDVMEEQIGTRTYVWNAYSDAREAVLDTITNLFLRARDGSVGVKRLEL